MGMFGKYLNNVPPYVPVGFDAWMANGGGTYIAPSFAMHNIDSVPESKERIYAWHGTADGQQLANNTEPANLERGRISPNPGGEGRWLKGSRREQIIGIEHLI